jgi:hypothetical protein
VNTPDNTASGLGNHELANSHRILRLISTLRGAALQEEMLMPVYPLQKQVGRPSSDTEARPWPSQHRRALGDLEHFGIACEFVALSLAPR